MKRIVYVTTKPTYTTAIDSLYWHTQYGIYVCVWELCD